MKPTKTIMQRACDPSETRWVVFVADHRFPLHFKACASAPHNGGTHAFPTLPEALDYARSQQPLEAP